MVLSHLVTLILTIIPLYSMSESSKHLDFLNRHCRVCGKRLGRDKYDCTKHSTILKVYGLDPSDEPCVKPPFFCANCYALAKWYFSTGKKPYRVPVEWFPHNDGFCSVCDEKCKGGRPAKKLKSNAGSPSFLHQHIHSIACEIPTISLSQVVDTACGGDITCTSCKSAVKNPVEILPCKSLICCECSLGLISGSSEFTCPGCSESHKSSTTSFTSLSAIEEKMIKNTLVECEKCMRTIPLSSIDKSCGQHDSWLTLGSGSSATLTDIVNQPLEAEPTTLEKQVATNIVTRLLHQTGQKRVVTLPTGGRVRFLWISQEFKLLLIGNL